MTRRRAFPRPRIEPARLPGGLVPPHLVWPAAGLAVLALALLLILLSLSDGPRRDGDAGGATAPAAAAERS